MSFRLRLILAFALLAALQAAFFTLLSDQLLRDGLEGEADERLALVGSLFARELPARLWPAPPSPGPAWKAAARAELADYASSYGLERASLLFDQGFSLDSRGAALAPEDYWLADGLKRPSLKGMGRVSGPLFHFKGGWHKTLYLKLAPQRDLWLRVEAGTPFLGQVSALQRRLFRLALALMVPSLLAGWLLAWALSARARGLAAQLEGSPREVRLSGSDEFAVLASKIDGLLKSLEMERQARDRLAAARLSQARHLAFGVAHELRNPISGAGLMLDLLRRKAAEGASLEELRDAAGRAQGELARVESTVARFLDFARTPVLEPVRLELAALAAQAGAGLKPAPAVSGRARALADAKSVAVILGVLLSNAAESAGESGAVKVALEEAGGRAWLRVSDSGAPVPAENRERLFTPFFTTKPKGLGLGMATAAGLADAMGGHLRLLEDSKTFEMGLPCPES